MVTSGFEFDVFVSHRSVDKPAFVDGLVAELTALGLKVWYDSNILRLGDDLAKSLQAGLVVL